MFFKSEKEEDQILFQTLPTALFIPVVYGAWIMNGIINPSDVEGYGIGFGIVIPSAIFILIFSIIIGAIGMTKSLNSASKKNYLLTHSICLVASALTLSFMFFLSPLLIIYIIVLKIKRKLKKD